ncbi:MAG: metal-dependent transcriptional regulator [Melioribacteraceae bacterium]|nr:metal-dependent transcriptional regulator [Melioribacteraceae bacterium]
MPTVSKENYLKSIFQLGNGKDVPVSTNSIAQKLRITNAATSDMSKKLAKQGLVEYKKYKGVRLTKIGSNIALGIIRRHRLWELFLMKSLGLSWGQVHDEAERLEHQTSEFLIDKIDEFLGNPELDPHGDPIPQKNGKIPKAPKAVALSKAKIGIKYEIARVNDESKDLINYITELGLHLNKKIIVNKKLSFDNSLIIKIKNQQFTLSEKVSEKLFVVPVNN